MISATSRQTTFCISALLATAFMIGCNKQDPVLIEQEGDGYANLMAIESAYRQYLSAKRKPPSSEEDLQPYGTTAESFVSVRDGKPLKVYWGTSLDETNFDNPTIVVHEVDGKDGKRLVLSTIGVMMLSEEEFAAARFPSSE